MKIKKVIIASAVAVLFTVGSGLINNAIAAEKGSGRGGASDLMLKRITTPAEADALKPGDELAMICTKCKSVVVHRVATERGGMKLMTVGEKHACPGCDSTIEVTGFGKGKHDEVKHVCQKCGDESAFCCATKPGAGQQCPRNGKVNRLFEHSVRSARKVQGSRLRSRTPAGPFLFWLAGQSRHS